MVNSKIQSLYIYPIKSMGGVSVDQIEFGHFGAKDDRRYMLVDEKQRFITQRTHPVLSQFHLHPVVNGWLVDYQGKSIVIDDDMSSEKTLETSVWKSHLRVREKSSAVSRLFSEQLNELVTLVEFDDLERRVQTVENHEYPFLFADAYPLLICNQRSLDQINSDLNTQLSLLRFRPNVVVDIDAEVEYRIAQWKFNEYSLINTIPCVRCNVPAIDPITSVFDRALHKRLAARLRQEGKSVFGVNAILSRGLTIKVGDAFKAT